MPASAGDIRDTASIPGSGRVPGGGRGSQLQYSCLENPMNRGAWWALVHGFANSQTQPKWHSTHARILMLSMRMHFILNIFLNSKEISICFILFHVIVKNVFKNTFVATPKMIMQFLLTIIDVMIIWIGKSYRHILALLITLHYF